MPHIRVSVIISAYNEEHTISAILNDLLHQEQKTFSLKKIVVITDGCSDTTAEKVRAFQSPLIILKEFKDRRGKAFRISEAGHKIDTDVVVYTDADTSLAHSHVLEHLITPFISEQKETIGLVCGNHKPLPENSFLEKIAMVGLSMYGNLKDHLGDKAIRYRCDGRLYALRGELARTITIPGNVATDTYTLYAVLDKKFDVVFARDAVVLYSLPKNLKDYIKQNARYMRANTHIYFPELTKKYSIISLSVKIKWFFKNLVRHKYPLHLLFAFLGLYILTSTYAMFYKRKAAWQPAGSTKIHSPQN